MATPRRNTHFIIPLIASFIDSFKRMVSDGGAGGAVSGTSASNTTGVTVAEAAPEPRVERWVNPPTGAVDLFAQQTADFDIATAAITQPTIARNVQAVFDASWDGGNIEVTGIRMSGASGTETIVAAVGTTVESLHGYQCVTRVRNLGTRTAGAVNVQTGPRLGVPVGARTAALQTATDLAAGAVAGATLSGNGLVFFNASPPNGARDYVVTYTLATTHGVTDAGHTHGAGTYAGAPASSAVHYDRGEYTITTANASSEATSIALCRALLVSYLAHRTDLLGHEAADTTNTVASLESEVVSLATAITAANQLKAAYNAHRSQSGVHPNNDSGHAVAAANATDQSSLNTLLNEMKGDFNAHIADGMVTPSWRVTDA